MNRRSTSLHSRRFALARLLATAGIGLAQGRGYATDEQPMVEELLLPGVHFELQFEPSFDAAARQRLRRWVESAARTVASYFGRFPLPRIEVLMLPAPRPGVQSGTAFARPQPYLRLRVGLATDSRQLRDDWVLVHEMVHLALPRLPDRHAWFHEGVATYVEAVARTRVGLLRPEQLWGALAAGMPRGQPIEGDAGLDHTPTWGRTYWGGAMFCLLADVQIRQRSGGCAGLQQALQGVLAAGGNYGQAWSLERLLAVADASVGQTCLAELHALMKDCPAPVDLDALWHDLGVQPRAVAAARLRSDAPLAALRRAIESPSAAARF